MTAFQRKWSRIPIADGIATNISMARIGFATSYTFYIDLANGDKRKISASDMQKAYLDYLAHREEKGDELKNYRFYQTTRREADKQLETRRLKGVQSAAHGNSMAYVKDPSIVRNETNGQRRKREAGY